MPSFMLVNGRLHHYRFRQHSGRAVVFANSLGTDLRIWDKVIANLPTDTTVLSYDKAGHGLSDVGATRIEDLAADVAALMDALGLAEAMVCGVSVGVMIAQALAAARPDLVAGLVLCNTAHRIGTRESWADRIASLDAGGLEPMADGILERWFSPRFRMTAPDAVAGYRLMLTRTPANGYRAVCTAIRDANLTDAARRIVCPTICIAGADDQATPPDTVRALAALVSRARYACYNGVGHLPCIEAPARLAHEIRDHLRRLL